MSKVFREAFAADGVLSPERLRVLKMVFEELCDEHLLTHVQQDRRDILATALIEAGQITSEEADLRAAGLRAITSMNIS